MIGIIDYGSGNISAFLNIFNLLGKKTTVIRAPEDLLHCSHILMPGVSAWDTTMPAINRYREILETCIHVNKVPFLGVCVGMQILGSFSEEGTVNGLDWIDGEVRKLPVNGNFFNSNKRGPKLPHMGWNTVVACTASPLMDRLPKDSEFYFLHSYYFDATNSDTIIAKSEHLGYKFPVVVQNNNIFGVQFHPEKSHDSGKIILENFSKL